MAPSSGAWLAAATALLASVDGHSSVNPLFTPNYYEHHNRTGYTDPCWVPSPFPINDFCQMRGFCKEDPYDNSSYICDCYYGYGGIDCSEDVYQHKCSDVFCGDSTQGLCVLDQNDIPHCECHSEWMGENCTEPVLDEDGMDFCNGVRCNDHGTCVHDSSKTPSFSCKCDIGWTGEHCGQEAEECYPIFLLDIFARLIPFGENADSAKECGFSKPILYSDAYEARSNNDLYAFCICSDLWRDHLPEDYAHYTGKCRMNMYRPLSFGDESDSYCPACNENQDAIMEDFLVAFEDICYHFIYERLTMPLYWRSIWKCRCMEALTESTAKFIITCPFQTHAAKDDYLSYENCIEDRVCDWQAIYTYFEEEMQLFDLDGARKCMDWLENWMFTIPGDQRFEEMPEYLCPCLTALLANCEDCAKILDCIPVTFHQLTVRETYQEICYDPMIYNRDCLNNANWVIIQLAGDDFYAATACYSAMELARSRLPRGDNLNKLLCLCIGTIVELYGMEDEYIQLALQCIPAWLQPDFSTDCPDYSGVQLDWVVVEAWTTTATPHVNDGSSLAVPGRRIEPTIPADWASSDLPDPTRAKRRRTESSDEEQMLIWRYVTLCQLPLIAILLFSSWYLRKQNILKKEELDSMWSNVNVNG